MSAEASNPVPSSDGATRAIGRWAAGVTAATLPTAVAHHGRRVIVDYLAASIAGSTNPLSATLRRALAELEPGERATAIRGTRLTAGAAAYANGTAAHGLELDDGYTPGSVHPGAAVVPAVLAVAEARGASIDDAARAVAVAVEVTCRIAAAAHPGLLNAGFHNTGVAGVFGAAVGVVNLSGGDEQQHCDALGLAGSHAGGLREYHAAGSEVKRLHAGKAARDGVTCGELAMRGISGPDTVLEGRQGFFSSFARGAWKPETLLGGLGEDWVGTRTYVKPYPCCRHLHAAIDAAIALHHEGAVDADAISAIDVGTYELATRFGRIRPSSLLEAQLSMPFTVAAALRTGIVTLETFGTEQIEDRAIQDLSERVSLHVSDDAHAAYPRERPAILTVTMTDGRSVRREVRQPLGEPSNPISDAELSQKFESLVFPVIGEEAGAAVLDAAWHGDDIRAITTALGR